jgi:hypothetical protein
MNLFVAKVARFYHSAKKLRNSMCNVHPRTTFEWP